MRKPVFTAKIIYMSMLIWISENLIQLSFSNFSLILVCIRQTESGTWKTQMFLTDLFPYPTQTTRFRLWDSRSSYDENRHTSCSMWLCPGDCSSESSPFLHGFLTFEVIYWWSNDVILLKWFYNQSKFLCYQQKLNKILVLWRIRIWTGSEIRLESLQMKWSWNNHWGRN